MGTKPKGGNGMAKGALAQCTPQSERMSPPSDVGGSASNNKGNSRLTPSRAIK